MALLLGALAGCSAIKLAYGSVDTLVFLWLDTRLDFNDEQKPRVRDDLRRLQAWHREQELPRIVDLLREVEGWAPGAISADQACSIVPRARERIRALAMRAELDVASNARELRSSQLAHLERKYASSDEDYRREWIAIDAAQSRERRATQTIERAEMVYGSLDDAQRRLVEDHVARSSFDPARVLAERQRRQREAVHGLHRIVTQRLSLEESRRIVRVWIDRALDSPDAAWRAYQERVIRENCELVAALHQTTTPAQRDAAARRLRAWQSDLKDLAGSR